MGGKCGELGRIESPLPKGVFEGWSERENSILSSSLQHCTLHSVYKTYPATYETIC